MNRAGAARNEGAAGSAAKVARLRAGGALAHAHALALSGPVAPYQARDLDDFVHLLCALYGRPPSFVDLALAEALPGPVRDWLDMAAGAFERERLYLVRLTAASGPIPSTPGAAETESALNSQRHALETLAKSERNGCALGAVTALAADWQGLRPLLDKAATRVGVEVPSCLLPGDSGIAEVLALASTSPGIERAIRFGAEQLLLQHRALFDLLEARSGAREGY